LSWSSLTITLSLRPSISILPPVRYSSPIMKPVSVSFAYASKGPVLPAMSAMRSSCAFAAPITSAAIAAKISVLGVTVFLLLRFAHAHETRGDERHHAPQDRFHVARDACAAGEPVDASGLRKSERQRAREEVIAPVEVLVAGFRNAAPDEADEPLDHGVE